MAVPICWQQGQCCSKYTLLRIILTPNAWQRLLVGRAALLPCWLLLISAAAWAAHIARRGLEAVGLSGHVRVWLPCDAQTLRGLWQVPC